MKPSARRCPHSRDPTKELVRRSLGDTAVLPIGLGTLMLMRCPHSHCHVAKRHDRRRRRSPHAVLGITDAAEGEELGTKLPRTGREEMSALPSDGILHRARCWNVMLPFVFIFGTEPVLSQPALAPSSTPSQSSAAPDYKVESERFQAKINAAALALRDSNPRLKNLPPKYVQGIAEFVSGNMLFVLLHEMAHATITQMGLPVLGRMEDAADTFATLRLIRAGSDFSNRVLTEAAKGWFLADRRDQKTGNKVQFYDEHGLNQQRAYQIVCLMVGSDDEKFKDLAKETKMPESRQDTCAGDFSNAAYSWDLLLKPYRRSRDQPKMKIDVVYGRAEGKAAIAQQVARSVGLFETVAEHASDEFAWPAPFVLEFQGCDDANARWDLSTHKLTVCYELAAEFADLYRGYGGGRAEGTRTADGSNRNTIGRAAYQPSQQTQLKRKRSR
jgi:Putative metallopeptidase